MKPNGDYIADLEVITWHLIGVMQDGYIPIGLCMGIQNKVKPHEYEASVMKYRNRDDPMKDSHGICCVCLDIMRKKDNIYEEVHERYCQ